MPKLTEKIWITAIIVFGVWGVIGVISLSIALAPETKGCEACWTCRIQRP